MVPGDNMLVGDRTDVGLMACGDISVGLAIDGDGVVTYAGGLNEGVGTAFGE
jgi:hypothetical protein